MDGILVDLLNAKWNTFVKSRFYRQFFLFCFYFVLSLISFTLRPGPSTTLFVAGVSPVAQTAAPATEIPAASTPQHPAPNLITPIATKTPPATMPVLGTYENSSFPALLEKILAASFASKLDVPFNVTNNRLNKLRQDIVSDVTSAFNHIFLGRVPSRTQEQLVLNYTIRADEQFHRANETATSDYLENVANDSFVGINSTILLDDVSSSVASNKHGWSVTLFQTSSTHLLSLFYILYCIFFYKLA